MVLREQCQGHDGFLIMSFLCLADTAIPNLHIGLHPRGLQKVPGNRRRVKKTKVVGQLAALRDNKPNRFRSWVVVMGALVKLTILLLNVCMGEGGK